MSLRHHLFLPLAVSIALADTASADEWFAGASPAETRNVTPAERMGVDVTPKVDERALRYYALKNQHDRVEAEARRLRALYPGWSIPADLYDPASGNEQPLWDLFGEDRMDDLAAAIEQRRTTSPGWQPSQELQDKIALKRERLAIIRASDAADWDAVIERVGPLEPWFNRLDIDIIWRKAEALGRSGASDAAFAIYEQILASGATAQERLATVQKSLAVLGSSSAQRLAKLGRTTETGDTEFALIADDILRTRVGEASQPGKEVKLSDQDLAAMGGLAERSKDSKDAALLGWYLYGQRRFSDSARWFERGLRTSADAALVEGHALSLFHLNEHQAMTDFAAPWLGREGAYSERLLPLVASVLVGQGDYVLSASNEAAIATALTRDGTAAQKEALGWYLLTHKKPERALKWFEASYADEPLEVRARGVVLAYAGSGDLIGAKAAVERYKGAYPEIVALITDQSVKPARPSGQGGAITAAYRKKDYAGCIKIAQDREARGKLSPDGKLIAAWCLHDGGESDQAIPIFGALTHISGRIGTDAVYGQALALLKTGLYRDANSIALSGRLSAKRRQEIRIAALADGAVDAFAEARYEDVIALLNTRLNLAAESRDLSLLRGWSMYHRNNYAGARELFEYLNETKPNKHTRAALFTVRQRFGRNREG